MTTIANRTALGAMNVMLQNGVVDGAGHSRGSYSGTDSSKRPSKLSVTKTKQEDSQDMNGGSLPSTPEVDGLVVSGRPAEDQAALDSDTRQLIGRFMADFSGLGPPQWRESRPLATMKRVVGNLMEKHRYVYNGRQPGFVCVKGGGGDKDAVGVPVASFRDPGKGSSSNNATFKWFWFEFWLVSDP